jgi:hypothetical protein
MPRQVPARNGGTLTRPNKGETMNPNGRPRKYVSLLRAQGYKLSEVNDCIQVMMSMTLDELKGVWDNKDATVLEKTIAGAIRKSIEKGSLYSIDTLLTRVYGKPKETADVNNTGEMTINVIYGNRKHNTGGTASGAE